MELMRYLSSILSNNVEYICSKGHIYIVESPNLQMNNWYMGFGLPEVLDSLGFFESSRHPKVLQSDLQTTIVPFKLGG